jgi:DNA modification methylase
MKRKLTEYKPDPNNANQHSERGMSMLEDSLSQVGAGRSLVADKNDILLAGNGVQEVAHSMGFDEVIEVETDGDALIVHKRRDLDLLNDPDHKARKLSLYDNRVQEVSLTWKPEALEQYKLEGVPVERMWTPVELEAVGVGQGEPPADPGAQVDKAQELQEKWQVQPGDLFQVGQHRILCGDSTKADDVARVMGSEKADMMVTDPPYGVEYDAHWREQYDRFERHSTEPVINDDSSHWTESYKLFLGAVAYVWHADRMGVGVGVDLMSVGFELRCSITWVKQHFVFSRGHYHWQHEPCWYAVRKGFNAFWIGGHNQTTVWDISNSNPMGGDRDKNKTIHSTEKPLECMARPIRNHDASIVYDPFLGSGTTLVACEQLNRRGRGIEIAPQYVAVCLERLSQMGLAVERITP